MPTLFWADDAGNRTVTRPDTDGIAMIVNVPVSLATGRKFRLVQVEGLMPEIAERLVQEFS